MSLPRHVRRTPLLLCLALAAGTPESVASAAEAGSLPYRMSLLRAAPGRQPELIEAVRAAAAPAGSLVLRHSQGDQWDVLVLVPLGSSDPLPRSALAPLAAEGLIAWQEDALVRGPELAELAGFQEAGLYHVEMFHALPGRREALVKEREMENAYLAGVGRPRTAIFTREWGASWDAFTVGAYRSWKHYAERDDIPPQKSQAAARAAGFESDTAIGPYLRSLILDHHDTLATPVR